MNIKILVCCHKQDVRVDKEPFSPIHVGKANSQIELNIIGDNTGDNISAKNSSYCELTGMYWAWKNIKDVDIIGLCHYRRYFDFHNQCKAIIPFTYFKTECISSIDFSVPCTILSKVEGGVPVVGRPKHYRFPIYIDFCVQHYSDDFRIMTNVVKKGQPDNIKKAFYDVMIRGNRLSLCNMFLMNWQDFDSYCRWLFGLLGEIEKCSNITNYNPRQKRIYGFMAERLFNVWLLANKDKLLYKPIIVLDDNSRTTAVDYFMDMPKDFISKLNSKKISYDDWLNAEYEPFYNIVL